MVGWRRSANKVLFFFFFMMGYSIMYELFCYVLFRKFNYYKIVR